MKFWAILLLAGLVPASFADDKVQFNRDVRKILAANCFSCHGQDAKKRKGKLRLDEEYGALEPKDGVAAIVPGNLEESEAWQRIISDDPDELMPPPVSKNTLTAEEVDGKTLHQTAFDNLGLVKASMKSLSRSVESTSPAAASCPP